MKIATLNVERPQSSSTSKNIRLLESLRTVNSDILVLTETNSAIDPGKSYTSFPTVPLATASKEDGVRYGKSEMRVTIWSKYPVLRTIPTCDPLSAVCVCLDTPLGELTVYGTVLGFRGNRHAAFMADVAAQRNDWDTLGRSGSLCISGDFNVSFSDNYYYTKAGRAMLEKSFVDLNLDLLTRSIPNNIDHIAISRSFSKNLSATTEVWNRPKERTLSDHIGVCLTFKTRPN